MPIKRKEATSIIASKFFKILSVKQEQLANAIVLICMDQEKYGQADKSQLQSLIDKIDELEPTGVYFPMFKNIALEFYDKFEFKNRDILVTIKHENAANIDKDLVEQQIIASLPEAKSVSFIHMDVSIGVSE